MSYIENHYNSFKNKTHDFASKLFHQQIDDYIGYFDGLYELLEKKSLSENEYYILNGESDHINIKFKILNDSKWYFDGFENDEHFGTIKGLDDFNFSEYKCLMIKDNCFHYAQGLAFAWNEKELVISMPEILNKSYMGFIRLNSEEVTMDTIGDYNYLLLLITTILDSMYNYEENEEQDENNNEEEGLKD